MNQNKASRVRLIIIAFVLLTSSNKLYSQDSTAFTLKLDTSLFASVFSQTFSVWMFDQSYQFTHSPEKSDKEKVKRFGYLLRKLPDSKNYHEYYQLACSLWELNRLNEAEHMFLSILQSTNEKYTGTYYHSSDIPGDTTTNIYGYGSYSSNYKNEAALYLTKIYIELKRYDWALAYLDDATQKYIVQYGCGTGALFQKREYDGLYSLCYEGSDRCDKLIDLLLPDFEASNSDLLVNALKKQYSANLIREQLVSAMESAQYQVDSFTCWTTSYDSVQKQNRDDSRICLQPKLTLYMFGKSLIFSPHSNPDEALKTCEDLVKEYKTSYLYKELAVYAGLPIEEDKEEEL